MQIHFLGFVSPFAVLHDSRWIFVLEELSLTLRGGESIHMVSIMIGSLQESPVTLAILNPCF